ncbi:DNA topoisomerase 3-alpha [Coemansia sp. RSA 1085]|nr:DNA topoisomerase 3-alpha [Coemansia sp. RSA 1085]
MRPSQARSVVQILSNGSFTTRNGRSRYNKNFDFQYRISGTFEQATMTSVAGHVTELDFPLNVRRWQSCNPLCLFTSPIVESIEERTRDIASNLELEARTATHLYIWTDCDREGEGIGYEVAEICRKVNPRIIVLRAHFSSVLPQEIHNAMQNPRGLDMRLVEAVRARAELDLRIGSALTRFQTLRLRSRFAAVEEKLISYGPCQFPTLGFVVDQFLRVESFVPETFWYIYLEHVKDDGKAVFTWRRQRLFDQEVCFAFYAQCVQTPLARVVSARMRPQEKWRPLPLTTVELQKCCARFLRMSPDNIMSVAEGLYNQGFVSYPRTETDQFDRNMDLRGIVAKLTQYPPFAEYAQKLGNGGFQWPRHGRNNDKAHPPIHPVAAAPNLTGDAKRVYEFITRRFLACCSQNAKGNATEVEVQVASERFNTKGLAIVARNYLEIYPYDRWAESTVPVYNEGDTFEPSVMEMRNGTTTAPRLLSEADLVDAMEKNGIGTDATHADHIKKIIDREYIFKGPDGRLTPSTLGVGLVEGYDSIGLELSLSKPYLRREMERELKQICEGTKTKSEVIRESINLYQAVYSKSVEEFGRLEQALSRCLQEEPRAGGWMPQGTTVGSDEVAKCPTCPEGALSLRARANGGGWMVGCSMYPQCHRVIWLPNIISAASVSDDNCAQCAQMNRGSVKLLDLKFRPGSLPPGAPSPYRGCILGCDELLSELFDIRPTTTGAGRSQPTQSQPNVSLQSQNGTMPARPPPSLAPAPAPAPAPAQQPSSNSFTLSDNPLCNCGILSAQRTVSRESANRGRPFYACTQGVVDVAEAGENFRKHVASQPIIRQRRIINPGATTSRQTGAQAQEAAKIHKDATTMTRVYEVTEFLKKAQRPCPMKEIKMHVHDFQEDGPEFHYLVNNAKVIYSAKDNTFAYKPDYEIRTSEELLEYLRKIPDNGGVEVKRLQDSYMGDQMHKIIQELRDKRLILAITDKDNRPRYIFYNHLPLDDKPIDQEMKKSWMRMMVPDENELEKEMIKARLQPTRIEKPEEEEKPVQKPKRAQRKTKITNTHLVGIDLTQD